MKLYTIIFIFLNLFFSHRSFAVITSSGGTAGTGPSTNVSVTSSALPSGASTESTSQQILNAIKAQIDIANSIWTDDNGLYYIRRESVDQGTGAITVSYVNPDGTAATPGTGLVPSASINESTTKVDYSAIAGGTGYSIDDIIQNITVINNSSSAPEVIANFWYNSTTSTVIAAPSSGDIQIQSQIISGTVTANLGSLNGAATSAKQDDQIIQETNTANSTASIDGKITTTANGIMVDGSGVIQPVSGTFWQAIQPISNSNIDSPISGLLTAIQALTKPSDTQLVDGSAHTQPVSGTFWQATQPVSIEDPVAVTGTFWQATQPVSIASMPTTPVTGTFWQAVQPVSGTVTTSNPATNYSLETGGNLETVANAQGNAGSGIAQPTGGAGILGYLSGIYKNLNNGIPATVSGTVNAVQSGSWDVSVNNFPLSFIANQPTASNLNATVVGTGGAALATAANQTTANASLSSIDSKLTSPLTVNATLAAETTKVIGTVNIASGQSTTVQEYQLGVSRLINTTGTSASIALSTSAAAIKKVVVCAYGANMFFALGNGSATASSTSHFLGNGVCKEFAINLTTNPTPFLAAIRQTINGTFYISEMY